MTERNIDSSASDGPPLSIIFRVLSERQRRYILYHLQEQQQPIPLEELIGHLMEQEPDEEQVESRDEIYNRLLTELHHTHIPMLVDAGIVQYDSETDLLAFTEDIRPLDEHLRLAEQYEIN